eukprot:Blabericola_migrator_1__1547@NODE_1409_length_4611_cov_20_763424_g937_i0_p3_GENE_NODE_1409_length_4611_cov_20_763424_g937_i0NODE_1409_length_4611_cov_20_763424_g937_i0_p3_ORF_typecomplete_len231_score36_43YfhO/PF09586_10/0_014DUF5336/PF17270_2/1_2DUF5336/PF17270_2/4e02Wzy_C/PF04932_15/13Wzy_C/PF04932_15/4_9ATP1G1_PLM_MAT8/PF02038_16/6_2e03ATP1G1_PLM_MAT8/PF02038_16/8_4ATP1G1_PLM_MAT8/PF02038_16/78CbiQ/PF02361_16/13CbiQ/PF02361_16/6_8L_HMGIC_fpl/PF10242_9/2_8e02L_HMGIC_fpl/PF10242_9/0_48SdpI/PF13
MTICRKACLAPLCVAHALLVMEPSLTQQVDLKDLEESEAELENATLLKRNRKRKGSKQFKVFGRCLKLGSVAHFHAGLIALVASVLELVHKVKAKQIIIPCIVVLCLLISISVSTTFNALVYFCSPHSDAERRPPLVEGSRRSRRALMLMLYVCCLPRWHSLRIIGVMTMIAAIVLVIFNVRAHMPRTSYLVYDGLVFLSGLLYILGYLHLEQPIQYRILDAKERRSVDV